MKRKLPLILVASSAIMLAASTIGSTKATLTYMSDNYLAQIDIKSIGVTLTENGNDVSWRDYKHKDDDWSEATGVLLGDMLENAGDEKLILDKKYDERLAVKNRIRLGKRCLLGIAIFAIMRGIIDRRDSWFRPNNENPVDSGTP